MTLPIFPTLPGLTWPLPKSSEFNTIIQETPNFMNTRIIQSQNPRWHWEMLFDVLRQNLTLNEYQQLQGFILQLYGQGLDFLYDDPSDDHVGPALLPGPTPNSDAELQVWFDGTNYFSPIQRNMGGFLEDVTDLNGSIVVYANGTLATVGTAAGEYEVQGPGLAVPGFSTLGLYLAWGAGVAPAGPVTAEFDFYFRCQMESDLQTFDQFLATMWTIGGSEAYSSVSLKFQSSRIPEI